MSRVRATIERYHPSTSHLFAQNVNKVRPTSFAQEVHGVSAMIKSANCWEQLSWAPFGQARLLPDMQVRLKCNGVDVEQPDTMGNGTKVLENGTRH